MRRASKFAKDWPTKLQIHQTANTPLFVVEDEEAGLFFNAAWQNSPRRVCDITKPWHGTPRTLVETQIIHEEIDGVACHLTRTICQPEMMPCQRE